MIRWIFAIFLAMPVAAQSAPIAVRSGEHADFSRVVLTFPQSPVWSIGRTADGYRLRIGNLSQEIALGGVFQKMTKNRIRAIRKFEDGLGFDVECLCHVDAFEFRPGLLVVDVKDGPPPANSAFEKSFARDELVRDKVDADAHSSGAPKLPSEPAMPIPQFAMPAPGIPVTLPADPPKRARVAGSAEQPPSNLPKPQVARPDVSMLHLEPNLRAYEMRERLLKQLGRASAQGLLDLPPPTVRVKAPKPKAAETKQASEPPDQRAVTRHLNFRAETQIDRDTKRPGPASLSSDGNNCFAPQLADVAGWGGEGDPWDGIVRARARLFDEVNQIREGAVVDLAKAYLFAGFGDEARAVLVALGTPSGEMQVLTEMAAIVDRRAAVEASVLTGQISCDTPAALWAALALGDLNDASFVNVEAILRTFSGLPLHFRRDLGPELSEKFLGIKDESSARIVRNAIARAEGDHGSRFEMLEADLSIRAGDQVGATDTLENIVSAGNEMSPQALLRLMKLQLKSGKVPRRDMVVAAQAMNFERQGTDFHRQMTPVLIEALSALGDHDEAVNALLALPAPEDALIARVSENIVAHASDAEFLRLTYAPTFKELVTAMPSQVRSRVSQRLEGLGFGDKAADLSNGDLQNPKASPSRSVEVGLGPGTATTFGPSALDFKPQAADEGRTQSRIEALPPLAKGRALIARSVKARAEAEKRLLD